MKRCQAFDMALIRSNCYWIFGTKPCLPPVFLALGALR